MAWTPARRAGLLAALLALEIADRSWLGMGVTLLRVADLALVAVALLSWGPRGFRWAPAGVLQSLKPTALWGAGLGVAALLAEWRHSWIRSLGVPGVNLYVFVFLAPLVEELVFRCLLLDLLRERLPGLPAVGISAALFALAHGLDPLPLLPLAGGLACGALAWGRGGILGAWILHAAGNAFLLAAPGLL